MSEGANTGNGVLADRELHEGAAELREAAILAGPRPTPTRVVVLGEFNSGKTSLVNALLGAAVLPTSFTTHTAYPTVIGFAAKLSLSAELANRKRVPVAWDLIDRAPAQEICRLRVGVPLERLKALRVIDTPGLGFGDEGRDAGTLRTCRGADTVIWCTPVMQAWKASEQRAWLGLPKRVRQRGILAITFKDAIGSEADANRVAARLQAEAGAFFRKIVLVSARVSAPAPNQAHLDQLPGRCRDSVSVRTAASLVPPSTETVLGPAPARVFGA